tara:strand:- start:127 stop:255 length:129 start_codon:yes stop_codon:yes gene_type:complete
LSVFEECTKKKDRVHIRGSIDVPQLAAAEISKIKGKSVIEHN